MTLQLLKKTTKRPEGRRGRRAIAAIVIRSAGAGRERERERERPRRRRPIMQNGPRLLKATLLFTERGERTGTSMPFCSYSLILPSNKLRSFGLGAAIGICVSTEFLNGFR